MTNTIPKEGKRKPYLMTVLASQGGAHYSLEEGKKTTPYPMRLTGLTLFGERLLFHSFRLDWDLENDNPTRPEREPANQHRVFHFILFYFEANERRLLAKMHSGLWGLPAKRLSSFVLPMKLAFIC